MNKKYYFSQLQQYHDDKIKLHLFYGCDFTTYFDEDTIWIEMTKYLFKWKKVEENKIELNFEEIGKNQKKN